MTEIGDTAASTVSLLPVDCRLTFCFILTGESQNLGKYSTHYVIHVNIMETPDLEMTKSMRES